MGKQGSIGYLVIQFLGFALIAAPHQLLGSCGPSWFKVLDHDPGHAWDPSTTHVLHYQVVTINNNIIW